MIVTDISRKKEDKKDYHFGAYCRVSTDKDDQVHSFLAQLKYFREYATLHEGYTLVDIYADEGVTGTSMDHRDEFLRMVEDAKKGRINRIVTKSVSRFARNNEELLAVVRELKAIGVSIYFEKECIDTETMNSEFMVSIFGMQAQQESKNISQNLRWSYKSRMKRGDFITCRAPFGYRLENGKLVIKEDEAEVVRRIFDLYLSGFGIQKIARIMNEECVIKSPKFGTWYENTISYILKNEKYKGDAILQKRYTTEQMPFFLARNKGQKEKYLVENSNPAIVTREVFEAAQKRLSEKHMISDKVTDSPYKKILKCPECKKPMRRKVNKAGPYWCCRSSSIQRSTCDLHTIYEKDLDRITERLILKLVNNKDELFKKTLEYLNKVLELGKTRDPRIHEIDMELKNAHSKSHTLASMRVKKLITDEVYVKSSLELRDLMTNLKKERRKLLHQDDDEDLTEQLELLLDTLENISILEPSVISELADEIYVKDGYLEYHVIGGFIFKERIDQ